jgi:hypothetical protein
MYIFSDKLISTFREKIPKSTMEIHEVKYTGKN